MISHSRRFWIVMIFAGWSFDFLFWKQSVGVNFAIFVSVCLAAAFSLLFAEDIRPARTSLLLVPMIGFFAVMSFVRLEPMTLFLAISATLGLIAILAVTYAGGKWPFYSLFDYFVGFFWLYGSMFFRGMTYIQETRRRKRSENGEENASGKWQWLWPVIRGILIAAPIVAIFATLLVSADLVFAQRLGDIAEIFSTDKIPEYIFRGIYILGLAYFLGGIVLHAATQSQDNEEKKEFKPLLGITEAAIIMGSVVILFSAFVIIQFQYFFGGEKNIDVAGYTYAEYARRGFGELVAVAVFSLMLMMALSALSRRTDKRQRLVFTGLGVTVVGLVLVMLVSAFQRILLYEMAYGFSRLRTYTHVFLIWLGLLLVAVIILEIIQRQRVFALAALLASVGFAATLSVMNVDGFIVHQNVQRARDGQELDMKYLESLSDDAVPAIADEFRMAPESTLLHNELGSVLTHFADSEEFASAQSWRSFNISHRRAVAAIDELDGAATPAPLSVERAKGL